MSSLTAFVDAPVCRALALSLVHFLWQGTLVALLLCAANVLLRRASPRARYAAACAALAAMLALPPVTVWRLESSRAPLPATTSASAAMPAAGAIAPGAPAGSSARTDSLAALAPWIVLAWLAGVSLFSLRFLGGFLAARRLARRHTRRPDAAWEERLSELAGRLAVSRAVRLLESSLVQVPTVIGVFRPVILLPAGIATGMAPGQLDSLLAHELAHIRRADCLVNLFQALAEAVLFYHPAVWWVSARVRIEREHACDDLAVAATGDALVYARALLDLAQRRRSTLALAVAADGGELWSRIRRLVAPAEASGSPSPSPSRSPRWIAGALTLSAVLALGAAARVPSPPAGRPAATPVPAEPQPAASASASASAAPAPEPAPSPERKAADPAPRAAHSPAPNRGLLTPDDLIAFRVHGVTPEFVGEIVALGYTRSSPEELVALRIHGVTPEYIQKMTATFGKLPLQRYVEFRIHGVDPESVRRLEAIFGKLSADDAVAMRIHGVDVDTVEAFRAAGYGALTADEAVSLRIHGATPEFARAMRAQGFPNLSVDDLLAFRIHGVTAEYVSAIRAQGYESLSADDVTAFRIHGLTPEGIRALNKRAGERLPADELIDWRLHDRSWARAGEEEEEKKP